MDNYDDYADDYDINNYPNSNEYMRCVGCQKTANENGGKYPSFNGFCNDCARCYKCNKTGKENGGYYPNKWGLCFHCEKINMLGPGG